MLLVLLLPVVALCPVKAETTSEGPILIVTSYNPETRSISDNLSAFMDEYRQRGGKYTPIIESMNCKNLSEAYLWKSRMASILGKYKGKPSVTGYIVGAGGMVGLYLTRHRDS